MADTKDKSFWKRDFWIRETRRGRTEYRTVSKVLFAILPFVLAALLYKLLIVIEDLKKGPEIIIYLAYGVGILLLMLILLMIIVSIIEYLNRFE